MGTNQKKRISKKARMRRKKYLRNAVLAVCLIFLAIRLFGGKEDSEGEKKTSEQKESKAVVAVVGNIVDTEPEEGWGSYKTKEDMKEEEWEQLPEKLKEFYERYEESREFIVNYWENKGKEFDINLEEYKDCKEVPLLMQWDKRWGYEEYSGNAFGVTGCGPTCLSMAAIYLKQDVSLNPKWMMEFSIRNGYSVTGSGSAWALIGEGSEKLGMESEELPLSQSVMKNRLQNGCVIIVVLGPGDFTDKGHFIVIYDYDEEGFIIRDPNSLKNTEKKWSYEELKGQIKNLWALSEKEMA
ncbi:MAG: C39 family peptidase [Lachnospiraceae bacterium]|nr:C39 family peptidase [Lachnospiraceae bacterium]